MVKSLINRLKKGVLIATAGLFLQGCPYPWPEPSPEPTPIVTTEPTASPTAEPTPEPTPGYVRVYGQLESNEEDGTLKSGEVRAYIDEDGDGDDENILYDYDGDFDFQNIPYGAKVKVKGRIGSNPSYTSYVRTKDLGSVISDTNVGALRAVPYVSGWTSDDKNHFKEHMGRTNYWSKSERESIGIEGYINSNREHGLKKWNHGELSEHENHPVLQGIKISKSIPSWADIKPIIQNSGYLGVGQIQIVEEDNPIPEPGWGVILKSNGAGPYTYLWDQSGEDGYIEHFETHLNTTAPEIVIHEVIMHGLLAGAGHSNSATVEELPNLPSMCRWQSPYPIPHNKLTSADIKANYIIDEDTYEGMESGDDILGMSW